jgi:hypothetical protein
MRRLHRLALVITVAMMAQIIRAQATVSTPNEPQPHSIVEASTTQLASHQVTDDFLQRLKYGREDVQRQAIRMTVAYTSLRLLLILFSSIAAFGKNFQESRFKLLASWIPIFSLLVAIGTSADSFLRLGQHRSGDYNYISNVEDIELRASNILATGEMTAQQLQELEERYSQVKAQHRRETAF